MDLQMAYWLAVMETFLLILEREEERQLEVMNFSVPSFLILVKKRPSPMTYCQLLFIKWYWAIASNSTATLRTFFTRIDASKSHLNRRHNSLRTSLLSAKSNMSWLWTSSTNKSICLSDNWHPKVRMDDFFRVRIGRPVPHMLKKQLNKFLLGIIFFFLDYWHTLRVSKQSTNNANCHLSRVLTTCTITVNILVTALK